MNFKLNKETLSILLIISFTVIIYFIGFYLREISNGAGHTDLQYHIWPLINDFKNSYFDTLKNYLFYKEATFPFFHTIQTLINPFTFDYIFYCLSNTIINLFILLIFFYFLKKKNIFNQDNQIIFYLLPFIFLLSPWFRSSSFWGMTENLSIFFLIPACFYFSMLIEKKDNIKSNFLLTLFISLTLYSRQQFIFIALAHILILILNKDFKKIFYTCITYLILSIPGLYVYNLWGVFQNLNNATSASDYISLKNIFLNIPKISTLILFYLIPIIFINFEKFYNLIKSKKFLIVFIIFLILEYLLFKNVNYPKQGGGYLIKFNKIFFNNNIYFIIILSSFFFALLYSTKKYINSSYLILLLFIFLIIGLPKYIYQEWFDPTYLIFYYMLLPNSQIININLTKTLSIYLLYLWELTIFLIAISYYHFYLKIPFFYNF